MGAHYTKDQKALYEKVNPQINEGCTDHKKFNDMVNMIKGELRKKRQDLPMILVDIVNGAIKNDSLTDKTKFYYLLVV